MKNLNQVILLCICLLSFISYANDNKEIKSSGETYVKSVVNGKSLKIKILTQEIDIKNNETILSRDCTRSRHPCSIVEAFEVTINNKIVFVPKSVFYGLSDLYVAKIQHEDEKFILELRGGDASEAYLVRLYFDDATITKKEICSLLDEHHVMEEIIYHKQKEIFD